MNELIEKLQDKNFPVLFTLKDLKKLNIDKKTVKKLFFESLNSGSIIFIYRDIYTLALKYRRSLVSNCVLAQMINPHSYLSLYFALDKQGWIPETCYTLTSVTNKKTMLVDTDKFMSYGYWHLYKRLNLSGVVERKDSNGNYMLAKPLRSICDLIYLNKEEWPSYENLCSSMRIEKDKFENLVSSDFDELQGQFNVSNVENFLENTRKELGI